MDDTPQYIYEGRIRDRVRAEGRLRFRDVFAPPYFKARLIGIFLAVLELVRNHGIGLEQGETADDLWLMEVVLPEEEKPQINAGRRSRQKRLNSVLICVLALYLRLLLLHTNSPIASPYGSMGMGRPLPSRNDVPL